MDFVTVLEREYERRIAANTGYSLRAFARDLKIDQSSLSKVLARKRVLTNELIQRIASNLKMSAAQTKKFLNTEVSIKHPNYLDLDHERFVVVSDWYHDAILELIDTKGFKGDNKWIATRLGIKESQVKSAIRRMVQLNLLKIEDSKWIDNSKVNSIHPEQVSTEALKTHQKQILNNSLNAIDIVDLVERSHTSNTFSASKENIDEAKKLIAKCRKDVAALLRSSNLPKTEVFQFQISLFPVTKNN